MLYNKRWCPKGQIRAKSLASISLIWRERVSPVFLVNFVFRSSFCRHAELYLDHLASLLSNYSRIFMIGWELVVVFAGTGTTKSSDTLDGMRIGHLMMWNHLKCNNVLSFRIANYSSMKSIRMKKSDYNIKQQSWVHNFPKVFLLRALHCQILFFSLVGIARF